MFIFWNMLTAAEALQGQKVWGHSEQNWVCPHTSQLYLCGMFAWAGNATHPGGLYRLRTTGQPMHLP